VVPAVEIVPGAGINDEFERRAATIVTFESTHPRGGIKAGDRGVR